VFFAALELPAAGCPALVIVAEIPAGRGRRDADRST